MELTTDHREGTCDCAETIDVNDLVITPDLGIGTVRVLHEHTAEVQITNAGDDWTTDTFRYLLSNLHLADSAAAMKDVPSDDPHVEPVACRTRILDEAGAPCGEPASFTGNTLDGGSAYVCPNGHRTFRYLTSDEQ